MAVNNEVNITLKAKDKASKEFKQLEKNAGGLGKKLKNLGGPLKSIGIGLAATGGAAILAGKKFISMANDQIRIETQLDAVLKSTKNAAGLTADEIKNMASSLQSVTTIGDETILAGQNMLLTFTQIGKDVFPQATETLLDMATAMNNGMTPSAEQLSAQAIQLGKALNDPIVGVTALSRVGVKFTDDQKAMIKTLTESGDVMGAQKIILAELGTEFGGQARAQADTFEGKMAQLSNTLGDVQEEIGKGLIPVLTALVDEYKPVILEFANSLAVWFQNKENINGLIETVKSIIGFFKIMGTIIGGVITVLTKLGEALGLIAFRIVDFVTQTKDMIISLGESLVNTLSEAKTIVLGVVDNMTEGIKSKFQGAIDFVVNALAKVRAIWNNVTAVVSSIKNAASSVASGVGNFISGTKANGGPVSAGQSYVVGERGSEVFVPKTDGTIVPNGGAGGNIAINMGGVTVNNEADENRLVEKIKAELTTSLQMYKFGIS